MGRKLTANVLVREPDTGALTCLEAGSEVPAWAADQVRGEHLYGEPEPQESVETPRPADADRPPPKQGKGATDEAWTEYARKRGVVVEDAWSRSEVIAACEAAGVPTK